MMGIFTGAACETSPRNSSPSHVPDVVPRDTLVFADFNWPSAQIQNRIVQYLAEKGYGYPTDVVLGKTFPLYQRVFKKRGFVPGGAA
jgi:ABC-type proline/glycine betaine transport system substrate-binding protein